MADHWSVTVERNGEKVVTIESNCLSGREISQEDEQVIRDAADHLLSFIGGKPFTAEEIATFQKIEGIG